MSNDEKIGALSKLAAEIAQRLHPEMPSFVFY
jgi:hypothetical protein